jgi:hypothetical protein
VGAIVELQDGSVRAEASQGSHFFQNITSLGIPYLMAGPTGEDGKPSLDWSRLMSHEVEQGGNFATHVHLENPFVLKVDGTTSEAVAYEPEDDG